MYVNITPAAESKHPACMPSTIDQTRQSPLAAIQTLQQQAQAAGQRGIIVAAGNPAWTRNLAEQLWQSLNGDSRLWLTGKPAYEFQIAMHQAAQYLGRECRLVIFDAHDGFSADAFGAASGTLVGGGLMLLLAPALSDWPDNPGANPYAQSGSRFVRHLVDTIDNNPAVLLLQEPDQIRAVTYQYPVATPVSCPAPYRSSDQQRAVEAVLHLATGHPHRPLVITSDRGRGKSASLGIAAARLLQQHPDYHIIVCAPRPAACNSLFEMARSLLPHAGGTPNRIEYNDSDLQFMAADALLEQRPTANLLLLDEAAGLPVPILQQLLRHYSRIVFATTVHGYEGTGRGFALKFHGILDQQTPGWRSLPLTQPVRWQQDDPLEQFINHALVLDASAGDLDSGSLQPDQCRFAVIERDALIRSPATLKQLFGLLVIAHYRTRPDDLYRLLDAPDIRLYALYYQEQPVAVGVVSFEGGFDPGIAEAIYLGRRRPQGHLLAQTLAFHAGVPDAARYRYARIMRLGVHPLVQRRGLGSRLLTQIQEQLGNEPIDAVGASFSASAELLDFWQHAGMQAVRMGLTREHTSGAHSVLVLKAITGDGESVFNQARDRFVRHLPSLLADPLRDLDSELVTRLTADFPATRDDTLTEADQQDIRSFIYGRRGYEVCAWPIEKLVRQLFAEPTQLACFSPDIRNLLSLRVLQKHDWKAVIAQLELKGKKAALQLMRQAVHLAYEQVKKTGIQSD
jgi:tRNA(Met) cytidine acetyltransferase